MNKWVLLLLVATAAVTFGQCVDDCGCCSNCQDPNACVCLPCDVRGDAGGYACECSSDGFNSTFVQPAFKQVKDPCLMTANLLTDWEDMQANNGTCGRSCDCCDDCFGLCLCAPCLVDKGMACYCASPDPPKPAHH